MTSVEVRQKLVHALGTDLIGPDRDGTDLHGEVLPQAPSRWYLTGFLVPIDADEEGKSDEAGTEGVDALGKGTGVDDEATPEPAAAQKTFFPSSMGVSLLVAKEAKELAVTVSWGDYLPDGITEVKELVARVSDASSAFGGDATGAEGGGQEVTSLLKRWRRKQRTETLALKVPAGTKTERPVPVHLSNGLEVVISSRPVKDMPAFADLLPKSTRSVSVFLVNRRKPVGDSSIRDAGFAFQAALEVRSEVPFVARPNLRGLESNEWDERVADLQYRDECEYAVGHGVATCAEMNERTCRAVHTRWIPSAEVERVAPATIEGVELRMEELAELPDAATASAKLLGLATQYRAWIEKQAANVPAKPKPRKVTAEELLKNANHAAKRIEAGVKLLADPVVFDAFRTANKVMAIAGRRRALIGNGTEPAKAAPPTWRPFQLAFLLMNLEGVANPKHADREVVDLLFFPTGGGKTEAYLGLAAFTLVYRRLTHKGVTGAGLSVLMRYTLRLLTLDQLGRAATLICALERERQQNADRLGDWPFEIGLWVGRGATPNEMGHKGHKNPEFTARKRTEDYQSGKSKASPIPLEDCPWCGQKLSNRSFILVPNRDNPTDLRITCTGRDRQCDFQRNASLPIIAVDEPIYRRLPCFLIATVDKFAAMPWTGPVGGFFGRVARQDNNGFYGPCHPNAGNPLPGGSLPPPDLVIQDELHLISGPMGTMVGLYETALDELCCRDDGGHKVRPKVVASTATVRRAEKQIKAIFCRQGVDIFPPPGPDRRDSFFSLTHPTTDSNARLYLGIAAQGRSPKVVLLRTYLALLGAAQKWYVAAGGKKNANNPADPYMTLLGYFNSLRELGGSRRIVEDEVGSRLEGYGARKREGEQEGLFAGRKVDYEPVELTSRVSTDKVAEAKRRLALPFSDDDHVDAALATNMISVGLDITRLGLMVVLGQPKASAEYIQATSRVGRDHNKPGLVVTILNVHRSRDRSHYERFAAYHQTFYRSVEATSVTPFSPRALDRGLAGTLVALARQGQTPLTAPKGATEILKERAKLTWVAEALASRAAAQETNNDAAEAIRQRVLDRAKDLLDEWEKIATEYQGVGTNLQYQSNEGGAARPLLYTFLDPELKKLNARHKKFRANRSMRDVEPPVNLWVRTLDNVEVEDDE